MRKILLATSALVALAGAAAAAEAPIKVTVGGCVDFRAAMFHESNKLFANNATTARRHGDFNTEYGLNIAAEGKAAGGIEYGAAIDINNSVAQFAGAPANEIRMEQAYVWLSGKYGKVVMGDSRGATDLFVMAPTVGEGQIAGSYTYFTDANTLARFQPTYLDTKETNTKFTLYSPKLGTAEHKVQLGVSFTPDAGVNSGALNTGDTRAFGTGNDVAKYHNDLNAYRDAIEVAVQYTGDFKPVAVTITPMMSTGEGAANGNGSEYRDATVWGIGAQAAVAGFTFGGSYVDAGHIGTFKDFREDKSQNVWTLGAKYAFDKVAVAANYMKGEGYYGLERTAGGNAFNTYVDDFSALGLGATYNWFPGLTSAADAVFFDQNRADSGRNNIGHVLMLSQKMAF